MTRVAICAPATPLKRKLAERVTEFAASHFPGVTLNFHEQCFVEDGHFAGSDDVRLAALLECANDPGFDAVWFAKGGYGSNRIARGAIKGMREPARAKTYCGYSDCGTLLAALYRNRIGTVAHSPMPVDIKREEGGDALARTLSWLSGDGAGLEPSLADTPVAAFNLTTLAMLVGTEFMPDLSGHEVWIEEVAEYEYAIDRMLFHVTQHLRDIAGLRLGETTKVPVNDRPFGADVETIVRDWCGRAGIPYLGRARIGHSSNNHVVPFGLARRPHAA